MVEKTSSFLALCLQLLIILNLVIGALMRMHALYLELGNKLPLLPNQEHSCPHEKNNNILVFQDATFPKALKGVALNGTCRAQRICTRTGCGHRAVELELA